MRSSSDLAAEPNDQRGPLAKWLTCLACPGCGGELSERVNVLTCERCGVTYSTSGGIPALLTGSIAGRREADAEADARTEVVRRFYSQAPFPGYRSHDTSDTLRARAERSAFARALDQAIPTDARILEVGCGTGQMTLFLATGQRWVMGADLTRASLDLGASAARRFGVSRALFVESDLRRPGLRRKAFDVVVSLGVLHHTPDPRAAFGRLVDLCRPGGMIVVGVYNAFARLPHRLRRWVARASGLRFIPFDPVLRDRSAETERRNAWIRDQYLHPEEHRHTLGEVKRWFRANRVEYLRTYPPALLGGSPDGKDEPLFQAAEDDWWPEGLLAQIGWMKSLGPEGGLFVVIGRRG